MEECARLAAGALDRLYGDPPAFCVELQIVSAEARSTPTVIFTQIQKQQRCCRGLLMTLYGSVGVLQHARALMATVQGSRITAVSRASQPSNQQPD
ncbi:hypothetical protein PAMA_007845 [Pampus argenteus]